MRHRVRRCRLSGRYASRRRGRGGLGGGLGPRRFGRLVDSQPQRPGQLLLGCLVPRRETDLAQQRALAFAALGIVIELEGPAQGVARLGQTSGGFLDFGHVIQCQRGLRPHSGGVQGLGLTQQRALVVRRLLDRSLELDEGFVETTHSKVDPAHAGVRRGAGRRNLGSEAIGRQSVRQGTPKNGNVAGSKRLFVAFVQIVRHGTQS